MSQVNTSMNFLPEDYVEKRQAARAAVVFIGLLLLVVTGVVGTYLYTKWSMKGIFEQRDRVNAAFEDASKKIAEAEALEKQEEEMVRKAEITTTLMERVERSVLLKELATLSPKDVRLLSLELKAREIAPPPQPNPDLAKAQQMQGGAVDLPPPPKMDVMMVLTGVATNESEVATFMSRLQNSPLLTSVAFLFSEELKAKEEGGATTRRFSVEMHVNPEADMRSRASATVVEK
jgi:Tfp pilus assembly protein PilN